MRSIPGGGTSIYISSESRVSNAILAINVCEELKRVTSVNIN